jgi:hypothetical protein
MVGDRLAEPRGYVVNYPGNPCFRPRFAFKSASTSADMKQREAMLSKLTVVITDEGPMAVRSREEVKDIIAHHFGVRKQEFFVYRIFREPFIAIFVESRARDVVFAAGRAIDGPIELGFHAWDLDRFGDRENIPYHVRLCVEGIPQHAWTKEVVEKVLCDEAVVHHVEAETVDKSDQSAFKCWVYCKDPSRIPQVVFLMLTSVDQPYLFNSPVQFNRPKVIQRSHVFRVLLHIDAIKDLIFYYFPHD